MSGIPWWNSDIGGFLFADIESEYFRELIVRWFQFGLFSPIMRLHGARLKTKNHIPRHQESLNQVGVTMKYGVLAKIIIPFLKSL
jgi:Alpha-glucosidases, family 31 of glycosyl hydrolases